MTLLDVVYMNSWLGLSPESTVGYLRTTTTLGRRCLADIYILAARFIYLTAVLTICITWVCVIKMVTIYETRVFVIIITTVVFPLGRYPRQFVLVPSNNVCPWGCGEVGGVA